VQNVVILSKTIVCLDAKPFTSSAKDMGSVSSQNWIILLRWSSFFINGKLLH